MKVEKDISIGSRASDRSEKRPRVVWEDFDDVEKAEEYERTYNFRFEESGSNQIVSYSRNVEGSMRRKDDSRKRERKEKKERKRLEKQKKREKAEKKERYWEVDVCVVFG